MLDLIAFDADDTLWHNERLYQATQARFQELLAPYGQDGQAVTELYETEMHNLRYYGYGLKSFTLSMIETAIRVTGGRIGGSEIAQIIGLAKAMIDTPVQLFDGVAGVIATLAASHPLMLITKGDLLDQQRKLAQSGLAPHFAYVEIVTDKTEAVYRSLLAQHQITPQRFLMVGNSLPSDVLPVVALGGHAVYIPCDITWVHETAPVSDESPRSYAELAHIGLLPALVEELSRREGRPL